MSPNVDSTGNNSLPIQNMNMGGEKINVVNTGAKVENLSANDMKTALINAQNEAATKAASATAANKDGDTLNIQGKEKTPPNPYLNLLLGLGPIGQFAFNFLNKPEKAPPPPPNMTMTAPKVTNAPPTEPPLSTGNEGTAGPRTPKEGLENLEKKLEMNLKIESAHLQDKVDRGEKLTDKDFELRNELMKSYQDAHFALRAEGGQIKSDDVLQQYLDKINENANSTLAKIDARYTQEGTEKITQRENKKDI